VSIAAIGVAAHAVTGSPRWEGMAALLIALQLAFVACRLGRRAQGLLIGEAADPALRLAAHEFLAAQPGIDTVLAILTMRLGPDSALLAARVDLADGLGSDAVEAVSGRIKAALTARFPLFDQVFIDITDATEADRERAAADLADLAATVREGLLRILSGPATRFRDRPGRTQATATQGDGSSGQDCQGVNGSAPRRFAPG
jgi:divalent metal cation (Fe/Co/Zn/Cd) transporter